MPTFTTSANGVPRRTGWNPTGKGDAAIALETRAEVLDTLISATMRHLKVAKYATGGTGTAADPYTGWDTAITWTANTTYHFDAGADGLHGHYACATLDLAELSNVHLIGSAAGAVTLKYTGSAGAVISQYNVANTGGLQLENLILDCNNAVDGVAIYLNGSHRGQIRNVEVRNLAGNSNGIYAQFCIIWDVQNFIMSHQNCGKDGIVLNYGSTISEAGPCTCWSVRNAMLEGLTGYGVNLVCAMYCIFIGGTSEANAGGVQIGASSNANTLVGMDCEGNSTGNDFLLNGRNDALINCSHQDNIIIAGIGNSVIGGQLNAVTVSAGALATQLFNFTYGRYGGALTINEPSTQLAGVANNAGTSLQAWRLPTAKLLSLMGAGGANKYLAIAVADADVSLATLPTATAGTVLLTNGPGFIAPGSSYTATGMTWTAPSAGKYKLTLDLCIQVGGGEDLAAKLYNTTTAADVANSERLMGTTNAGYWVGTTSQTVVATLAAGDVIELYAKTNGSAAIYLGTGNRNSALTYEKVAD